MMFNLTGEAGMWKEILMAFIAITAGFFAGSLYAGRRNRKEISRHNLCRDRDEALVDSMEGDED